MKSIIGFLLMAIGVLIFLFGGIGWMLYEIYQVLTSTDPISGMDVFWLFVTWFVRDIIAFIVGAIFFILGKFIAD